MFVRIKRRKLASVNPNQRDYSLRFMVVESYRTNGAPRQRVVKYLGSVRRSEIQSRTQKKEVLDRLNRRLDWEPFSDRQIVELKLSLIRAMYHRHPDQY